MCIIRKFVVWFDSSSFFPLLPGITPFLFLSEGLPLSSFPPFGAYFVNPRANPAEKSLLLCHLKSAPAGEKPDPSGSDKCDCFCITLIYEALCVHREYLKLGWKCILPSISDWSFTVCMCVCLCQSCPTLCNPRDCSPP